MPRVALIVAYNGQHFHGWQYQGETLPTVQRDLTRAVAAVADTDVTLFCAGRTDTGVHASKQVVHFDTLNARPTKAWTMGVNAHLLDAVSVEWAGEVSATFDARRTATARRYLYFIHNSRIRSALMAGYVTHVRRPLDEDSMHKAAQALLGENDFSSFRAANCQSQSPMRNVMSVSVSRRQDLILVDITANAFLHHMVRNIVGTLLDIGAGLKPVDWMAELLLMRDRQFGGATASPEGLYLADVRYPEQFGLPQGLRLPHFFQVAGLQ